MKYLLLPLALCAGLAGCYAPYPYYYPRYAVYTVPSSQDPNAIQPAPTPNGTAQSATVVPYPITYGTPYGYPYGYATEAYPYPYGYPYPYAYPYGYGYGYGYAPLWISGSWYSGGHHGGDWHGGHGGGQWHGGGGGHGGRH